MTTPEETCSFSMEVDGAEWECPHQAIDGQRCLYHLSPSERKAAGYSKDDVRDAFVEAVDTSGRRSKQFVGAELSSLDLSYHDLDTDDNYPIDLREAFIGELRIVNAALSQPIEATGAEIDQFQLENTTVQAPLDFQQATFNETVQLATTVDTRVEFSDAVFCGPLEVDHMSFNGYTMFDGCVFHELVKFYVDFNEEVHFTDAEFHAPVEFFMDVNADSYFDELQCHDEVEVFAEFNGDVYFDDSTFADEYRCYGEFNVGAMFREVTFCGRADFHYRNTDYASVRFEGGANFAEAEFESDADFSKVSFNGGADFTDVRFAGQTDFQQAEFDQPADFTGVQIEDLVSFARTKFNHRITIAPTVTAEASMLDFSDSVLSEGEMAVTEPEVVYDLEGATVGDMQFTGSDATFEHFRTVGTDFDNFDFSLHRKELARSGWTVHKHQGESESLPPERVEATYLKAKNGASAVGENHAASQFFIKELRSRRERYRENFPDLSAVGKYLANRMMELTCGYGERPWRVVASSGFVIGVFAVIYAIVDIPFQAQESNMRYLVLSIETFVALVLGSPQVTRPIVNVLTATEAFAGAYFIALFVFTLTRSVHR